MIHLRYDAVALISRESLCFFGFLHFIHWHCVHEEKTQTEKYLLFSSMSFIERLMHWTMMITILVCHWLNQITQCFLVLHQLSSWTFRVFIHQISMDRFLLIVGQQSSQALASDFAHAIGNFCWVITRRTSQSTRPRAGRDEIHRWFFAEQIVQERILTLRIPWDVERERRSKRRCRTICARWMFEDRLIKVEG